MRAFFSQAQVVVRRAIFESSEKRFGLMAGVALVLFNGVWLSPAATRMYRLAQDPFTNPFKDRNDWLLENYLLPLVAGLCGANGSILTYAGFCFGVLGLGLLTIYWLIRSCHGRLLARSIAVIFIISPASLIVLGSIGYADTITILYGTVLALFRSRIGWTIPCSLLMGLNHWGQGLVILLLTTGGHLAATPGRRSRDVLWFIANVAALLFGLGLLYVLFARNGIFPTYDRIDYFVDRGPYHYFKLTTKSLGLLAYSTFGCLWLLAWWYLRQDSIPGKRWIGALFVGAWAVAILNVDQTRVFALVTWPLVVIVADQIVRAVRCQMDCARVERAMASLALAGLLIPKVAVWDGEPYGSLMYHDVLTLIEGIRDPDSLKWEDNRWVVKAFNR